MEAEDKNNPLALVFLRNDFYRKKLYIVLAFCLFGLLGNVMLSIMLVFLVRNPPHPLYFVADPVSRLLPYIPTSQPTMALDDVAAWVVEAVTKAYTYSYINYRAELTKAQKYFTPFGWSSYMKGLQTSNNLLALTQRKMIQIAELGGPPELIVQGHMGSAYAYQFKIPIIVTYWLPPYDDNSKNYNRLMVTVTVARMDLLQSYKGLGISQMNAELLSSL